MTNLLIASTVIAAALSALAVSQRPAPFLSALQRHEYGRITQAFALLFVGFFVTSFSILGIARLVWSAVAR